MKIQDRNRLITICYNVSAAMIELQSEIHKDPTNIQNYDKLVEQK